MSEVIELLKQVRDDVTDLSKSVSRSNAKVVCNGVKLDNILVYNAKCDKRLSDLEEISATRKGFEAGKSRKALLFGSRTKIICAISGVLIAFAGLWFSIVSPALEVSARVLDRIESVEEATNSIRQEALAALKALKH